MTVSELMEKLQDFPSDYLVGFQTGDTLGSEQILLLQEISADTFFGIVDFVFKETDNGF